MRYDLKLWRFSMVLKHKRSGNHTVAKTEALETATTEATARFDARIPASLHRKLRDKAYRDDTSMSDIATRALKAYLEG